jgi:peroxiredoxin
MITTRTPAGNRFPPIDLQPHATPMPNQTDKTLAQLRSELLATFSAADWESYNHLVGWLRNKDVASHALKVGDVAPDFLLPDADGRLHSSEQLRRDGPLVLSFFRGSWCPFCAAELCALQAAKDDFESVGATLAVVTPETRDFPRQLKQRLGLDLKVLSDVDYGVAVSYGVLFRVPDETIAHYSGLGFDFGARHGSPIWMLPIPATYVIDVHGRIRSAFIEPDFTIREDPEQILATLRQVAATPSPDGPTI